jgi:DNA-binding transcriptional regulator YbjK
MIDRREPSLSLVLHAAMELVAASGLKGLSLRPLAEKLGTTVSALTHRYGLKDTLLASIVAAAAEADGAFLDTWLARVVALETADGAVLADVADAVLADLAGPEALRAQFYCELLQGAAARPDIAAPLAAWQARRLVFWRALAAPLGRAALGDVLHAYSTDEAAHGLALGDLAAYRWLRRLNLRRLCCSLIPAANSTEMKQFLVFHAALGELRGPDRYQAPKTSEWHRRAARHISAVIILDGPDAVTHRAIAARANVANSTLAYHFPRQQDLLKAGIDDIIVRAQGRIDAGEATAEPDFELSSIEIARATFAVALAATRMPDLKTFAADMRRRRGENYLLRLQSRLQGKSSFDLLSAQAMAITGIGQLMLDAVIDAAGATTAFSLVTALEADSHAG